MNQKLFAVIPVLMSRDLSAALALYAKLGFAVDFTDAVDAPRYAGISRDGAILHLQWQDAAHWANSLDRPAYRFPVRDLDAVYAEFVQSGALASNAHSTSAYRAPAATPWGTTEFHLLDADGNCLQFFSA